MPQRNFHEMSEVWGVQIRVVLFSSAPSRWDEVKMTPEGLPSHFSKARRSTGLKDQRLGGIENEWGHFGVL